MRVAARLGFKSLAQMDDHLSPRQMREWMALARRDRWGEEWKMPLLAAGAQLRHLE